MNTSVMDISSMSVPGGCSRKNRRYERSIQWYHRNELASDVLPVYIMSQLDERI